MQKFQKGYIILIGIFVFFAGIVLWVQSRPCIVKTNVDISTKIPLHVGEWQGEDISVDDETKNILETEEVLIRRYINSKEEKVFLSIVYYKDSRVALHLPESCLTGQGSRLIERKSERIEIDAHQSFLVNQIITTSPRGNQLVLYYFKAGNLQTNSYMALRWQMMKNKLMAKSNSGALVKFSAPIEQSSDKTLKILKQFIKAINSQLNKYLI